MPTRRLPRAGRIAPFAAALVTLCALASVFLSVGTRSANATYYSKGSLPPELVSSWSSTRDGLGASPLDFTSGDTFVIQDTHNMSTFLSWSVSGTNSKVQIEKGGTLTANSTVTLSAATTFQIDDGGTYVQNASVAMGSSILQGTEAFGANSNFVIQAAPTGTSKPSSPGYGNLTINITAGTTNVNWGGDIEVVQGSFTVQSTGANAGVEHRLTSGTNLALSVGGSLNISGGTLVLTDGAGVPTVHLGGGYDQTGGTLTSTGSAVGSINFTGGTPFVNFVKTAGTLDDAKINWSIAGGKTVEFDDPFTNAASRTFTVDPGGMLLAADTITNNGALNVNGEFRLTDGGWGTGTNFTYGADGTLGFASSGSYGVNGDAYWPTSNGPANVTVLGFGITMNVARSVPGLFDYSAGVAGAGNLTLDGTSQVSSGGYIASGAPTYGPSSTLKYNTGLSYGRNGEWLPGATSGAGYPVNVQVSNHTTLDLPNGSNGSAFQLGGNLTIDSGSTLGLGALTQALTATGAVTNNGTLTLSTALGGDIKLGGNWQDNGTFTPNNRAVFFEGGNTQTLNRTPAATETFNYLVIDKTSNSVQFQTNVAVNATTGNALQLLGDATPLDLATKTLTMSGNGGSLFVSGGGHSVTSSSGTGVFAFSGTKSVAADPNSTLSFDSNVTVNLSAGVNFGSVSTVGGTLSIKSGGFVDTNPPTYASDSTLEYDTGTTYNAAAEFPATGVQNVRLNSTTQLGLNGDKTVAGTLELGANKVDAGAHTLTLGDSGSITNSTGYVLGTLQKSFSGVSDVSFTFPVGTANGYSPVNAEATTGTGSLSVKATQTKQPNITGTDALARYWTLSGSGLTTDLTFNYLDGDVVGDENNYRVVKYDGAFTLPPNQSVNAADNFATVSGVSSFSDWTLAEPASVFPPLSGTKTVCASGCDYVNLTGAAGLFAAINGAMVDGNIVAQIKGDLTEDGTNALNQWTESGSGGYTLTIEPFDGTTKTVSGDVAAGMIRLDGADRVTIDGRSGGAGRFLTFRNTNASGATIKLSNDASNNTVRSSVVEGAAIDPNASINPTVGVVTVGAGAATGNDDDTVTDNQIRDLSTATGVPSFLFLSAGTSAAVSNSNGTVSDNELFNFKSGGVYVSTFNDGSSESWAVTGNNVHQTAASADAVFGILLGAGGTSAVKGNTVHDLTSSADNVTGIQITPTVSGTVTAARNRVYSLTSTANNTETAGITASASGTATVSVENNQISLVPSGTNSQNIFGLFDVSGTGTTVNFFYNTVLVGGTASGSYPTWACMKHQTSSSASTWRDNICFNNRTGGGANHFAAGDESTAGSFSSDYNVFVGTGTTASDFFDYGTADNGTPVSFATWQSSTGGDAHSLASTPGGDYTVANMFTSTTDLHLNTSGTNPASNAGTPVGSVTKDFDDETRDAVIPDIGADEVAGTVLLSFSSATYSVGEGGGTVTVTVRRTGSSVGAVAVHYATGDDSATAGSDYTAASGTLNWNDGDLSDKSFTVGINNDGDDEPDETFNVTLSLPAGAALGTPNTAVVTINDDDVPPTSATLVVTSADDTTANDGLCTLREAITNANHNDQSGSTDCAAGAGADTITFDIPGAGPHVIQLTTALPALAESVDILNTSGESITVNGEGAADPYHIFFINSGQTVNISGLTITNGSSGIQNAGTLTLTNSTVSSNTTPDRGGGIQNTGTLTLTNSTVSGNTATNGGGGIFSLNGTLTLTDSTVSGNSVISTSNSGGGISAQGGTMTLTNCTVSGNSATNGGGGIRTTGGTVTLTGVTVTDNHSDSDNSGAGTGGGIIMLSGTLLRLRSTIVADNYRGSGTGTEDDIGGGSVDASSSYNLIGTGGAGGLTNGTNGNQVGVADPGLLPLANNGGPTQTHALSGASPAIDKGNAFGSTTDQRGVTRPTDLDDAHYPDAAGGDATDIGAFELQFDPDRPSVVSVVRASADPTTENTVVDFNVTFSESVTGVDSPDFAVNAPGGTGAAVTNVAGSGTMYTVSVNTGTGASSVRLDVTDDDSIKDADNNPLGGAGAGNGDFNTGESYTVLPSLSISDVTKAEGNSGTTAFTFDVTKTGAGAASVDFATQDDLAEAGSDYVSKSGTLNFASGDTTKQVTVLVNGDTTPETDEDFLVVLSNPSGATVTKDTGIGTISNDEESVSAGQLIISEFRLRGPGLSDEPPADRPTGKAPAKKTSPKPSAAFSPCGGGSKAGVASGKKKPRAYVQSSSPAVEPDTSPEANDEFIELYNNTDSPLLVTTTDGSEGWAVAASDGLVRFIVPNGTYIPPRAHFLSLNLLGYSLYGYPAGDGSYQPPFAIGDYVIRGDGTDCFGYELDIPDNAGIALFRTSDTSHFNTDTRLDAVGSTSEANTLYKEGTGYPALAPEDIAKNLEHSFYRSLCSYNGAGCSTPGIPKDTNDNAADFLFVDTQGTPTAAGQRLGAPGPENLASPVQRNGQLPFPLLDRTVSNSAPPNRVRTFDEDAVNNSTFGTLSIRRRLTNNTGAPVTALRFRIVELTTLPAGAGTADLRARDSADIVVTGVADTETCSSTSGGGAPCDVDVYGLTLEQPPSQENGGGLNSSLNVGTVTFDYPLAPGESINVHFLLGIQQTGAFRFLLNVEAVTDECSCPAKPAPARRGARPR